MNPIVSLQRFLSRRNGAKSTSSDEVLGALLQTETGSKMRDELLASVQGESLTERKQLIEELDQMKKELDQHFVRDSARSEKLLARRKDLQQELQQIADELNLAERSADTFRREYYRRKEWIQARLTELAFSEVDDFAAELGARELRLRESLNQFSSRFPDKVTPAAREALGQLRDVVPAAVNLNSQDLNREQTLAKLEELRAVADAAEAAISRAMQVKVAAAPPTPAPSRRGAGAL